MAEYVSVAIADATSEYDRLYTYAVPAHLEGHIFLGSTVLVPFGRGQKKPRIGVVLAVGEPEGVVSRIKELLDAAPGEDALGEEALAMVGYLKQATFCTWYEAVKTVVPRGARYKAVRLEEGKWTLQADLQRPVETVYTLPHAKPEVAGARKLSAKQQAVLAFLEKGPKSRAEICEACDVGPSVAQNLEKKGLLCSAEREKTGVQEETPAQAGLRPGYDLSEEQRKVARELCGRLVSRDGRPALLYGVTGSGKTAVFLELARQVVAEGKTCLILVPEIGLTPQMIEKLREVFGPLVAVQHSALSAGERFAQWQSIRRGGAKVVVGTRSAVFAPLEKLGLIVVDEEQERSYQSDASPRYDAVEVAKRRAARHGALLLLASATPSVASYYAACEGRYTLHTLACRYGNLPLPAVEMVDMHEELMAGNPGTIGRRLSAAIEETIEGGKQVILLLNRRGYHRVGVCRACGKVLKCTECSVPMIYHRGRAAGNQQRGEQAPMEVAAPR
ncbi:primosomal protein N', partial [Ruminococcaceae bacterium OttesenSCG-928-I18]|nr:primosomal protein N' [Ruminococcaceae bacterium OttesenSCG-928-I18]